MGFEGIASSIEITNSYLLSATRGQGLKIGFELVAGREMQLGVAHFKKLPHRDIKSLFLKFVFICASSWLSSPDSFASEVEAPVMAPLLVYDPRLPAQQQHREENLDHFRRRLESVKKAGTKSIAVDFWWGLVQRDRGVFDWDYYTKDILPIIIESGLQVDAILSSHACGGNIGDDVNIPTPRDVRDVMPKMIGGLDARNKSELGRINEDSFSPFAINSQPRYGEDHPLGMLREFYESFRENMAPFAPYIKEITIGTHAAGELVYTAYHAHDRRIMWDGVEIASYPNRGALQASSDLARLKFKQFLQKKYEKDGRLALIDEVNAAWGTQYKSFEDIQFYIDSSHFQKFLEQKLQYSKEGQDFFDWYSGELADSGFKMALNAYEVFENDPKFKDLIFSLKIPGIHWNFQDRLALLTAGQVTTSGERDPKNPLRPADWSVENGLGYRKLLTSVFGRLKAAKPQVKWKAIFTCAEQPNCSMEAHPGVQGSGDEFKYDSEGNQNFGAYDLVGAFAKITKELGIRAGIENSMEGNLYSHPSLDRMYAHLQNNPHFETVTLLRIESLAEHHHPARGFIHAVNKMRRPPPLPKTDPTVERATESHSSENKGTHQAPSQEKPQISTTAMMLRECEVSLGGM